MVKTKTRGEGSRAIRDYFSRNPMATAQEVVDGLKAEGVTVTASLVYNVKASGKRKKAAKKAAVSTNGAASSTKADQIREVAGGMEKPVRPRDVIAILKEKGVTASSAQVSTVLLAMGMKKRKRRRRKMAVAGSAAVAGNSLNIDDLVAAKKLVSQVGSVEKVREALAALARLS